MNIRRLIVGKGHVLKAQNEHTKAPCSVRSKAFAMKQSLYFGSTHSVSIALKLIAFRSEVRQCRTNPHVSQIESILPPVKKAFRNLLHQ